VSALSGELVPSVIKRIAPTCAPLGPDVTDSSRYEEGNEPFITGASGQPGDLAPWAPPVRVILRTGHFQAGEALWP